MWLLQDDDSGNYSCTSNGYESEHVSLRVVAPSTHRGSRNSKLMLLWHVLKAYFVYLKCLLCKHSLNFSLLLPVCGSNLIYAFLICCYLGNYRCRLVVVVVVVVIIIIIITWQLSFFTCCLMLLMLLLLWRM